MKCGRCFAGVVFGGGNGDDNEDEGVVCVCVAFLPDVLRFVGFFFLDADPAPYKPTPFLVLFVDNSSVFSILRFFGRFVATTASLTSTKTGSQFSCVFPRSVLTKVVL